MRMTQARLPSFLVIGAAKAATTWIAQQFRSRTDIFIPGPEPHFFSREYSRGLGWYADWFAEARADQLVGEKSADYLADANAPARIHTHLPAARLIVQLRNPVERAYSDFCMLYRRGQVDHEVSRHLDWNRTKMRRFLADGLYAQHLRRYLDYFPAEQLTILLHDEVAHTPERALARVSSALGIAPWPAQTLVAKRVNDGQAALVPLFLRRLPSPIKRVAAPLRGWGPFERCRGLIARKVDYPPLPAETRRRMEDFYRHDVEELGRLLRRDLSSWLIPLDV